MYKGYSASFYSIIIHGYLYFALYKAVKGYLKDRFKPETTCAKALIYALSASLSQTIDVIGYPLEMIRVRLLASNDVYQYKSVSHAISKIVKEETWRGLYRGSGCYSVNLIGTYSISLTLYELFIDAAMKKHGLINFKKSETMHVIEASVFSTIVTVLITNSMEVLVIRR